MYTIPVRSVTLSKQLAALKNFSNDTGLCEERSSLASGRIRFRSLPSCQRGDDVRPAIGVLSNIGGDRHSTQADSMSPLSHFQGFTLPAGR